ncbi:MAG: YebC/PmpR family DNA-binding transcriptional regulator [Candidatus Omnitrophica bacterium]|nr:YebC/PmpR family DNA-binding transcriptional regulator [Candidatus Omnitrophota bacterium]MBU0894997.1 YebC/PmpR family DNA-binding transcriptional regulator [Candidatus Omnitrophota bacterium]MBU1038017.1 YebC/PmpR family DNA-binding transcriptional regulator [Candidatus Omnitrophota bacterium]MBU1808398.1 YebC/PmpR family DNA-binding transcriptional regulator [Candidatus Omnitrophota bacterium]
MSGHSKWATIKHKKAATDAKRGSLFTKLIKEITIAARSGGKPETNPRLRVAIERAKEQSMPADNIERAVKKGTGELEGVSYEDITFEGYGPGGVAIFIEGVSDNKNRATSEVRTIFSKRGSNMAGAGSVSWMFEKKGYFVINKKTIDEDKLMGIVLDAGAEDLITEDENYAVKTAPADFFKVKKALEDNKIATEDAEITLLPKSTVKVTGEDVKKVLDLVDALEEHEDVQHVYANFDIPDELIKE